MDSLKSCLARPRLRAFRRGVLVWLIFAFVGLCASLVFVKLLGPHWIGERAARLLLLIMEQVAGVLALILVWPVLGIWRSVRCTVPQTHEVRVACGRGIRDRDVQGPSEGVGDPEKAGPGAEGTRELPALPNSIRRWRGSQAVSTLAVLVQCPCAMVVILLALALVFRFGYTGEYREELLAEYWYWRLEQMAPQSRATAPEAQSLFALLNSSEWEARVDAEAMLKRLGLR